MGHCMGALIEDSNFEDVNTFYANLAGIRIGKSRRNLLIKKGVETVEVGWSKMPVIPYNQKQYDLLRTSVTDWNEWRKTIKPQDKIYINLQGADLSTFELDGANLSDADLQGATFIGTSLKEVNLENANLAAANLQKASLHKANLTNTNMLGCDLRWAYLDEATIEGAALYGCDLSYASPIGLDMTEFQNAIGRSTRSKSE